MLLVIIKTLVPALATWVGATRYAGMPRSSRYVFIQVFLYVVLLALTNQVMSYQRSVGDTMNTIPIYNLYIFVESALLLACGYELLKTRVPLPVVFIMAGILPVVYITEMSFKTPGAYCILTDLVANLLLLLFFSVILYFECIKNGATWYRVAEVWYCIGIIVFSACTLPYMSLSEYLQHEAKGNTFLFRLINLFFANVRYLCVTVGFYLLAFPPKTVHHGDLQ